MGSRPMSSYPEDYAGVSERKLSVNDDHISATHAIELDDSNRNNDIAKIRDPYNSQRSYNAYDEYQDLETLDEHDQEDENNIH